MIFPDVRMHGTVLKEYSRTKLDNYKAFGNIKPEWGHMALFLHAFSSGVKIRASLKWLNKSS